MVSLRPFVAHRRDGRSCHCADRVRDRPRRGWTFALCACRHAALRRGREAAGADRVLARRLRRRAVAAVRRRVERWRNLWRRPLPVRHDQGRRSARAPTSVLDFNFAYNPSCADDERWSCPLSPPENRLPFAVTAGDGCRIIGRGVRGALVRARCRASEAVANSPTDAPEERVPADRGIRARRVTGATSESTSPRLPRTTRCPAATSVLPLVERARPGDHRGHDVVRPQPGERERGQCAFRRAGVVLELFRDRERFLAVSVSIIRWSRRATRESSGTTPGRYLPLSTPRAIGEYGATPSP